MTNEKKRIRMVEEQIKSRGIRDNAVLEAMRAVERHLFVPGGIEEEAYSDQPLPIGYGQTISQPYIVAYMTEALRLKPEDTVLEIGTGSGYQTAVLAEMVKEVYSVETIHPLAERAGETIKRLGYGNVKLKEDDGYQGWPDAAPFDAIMVTAAPAKIPGALSEQLKPGGRMIIPAGEVFQQLYLITREKDGFDEQTLIPVRFVPMVRKKMEEKKN